MNLKILREALSEQGPRIDKLSRNTGISESRLVALSSQDEPTLREWRTLSKALRLPARSLVDSPGDDSRYGFLFRRPTGGRNVSRALLAQLSSKMRLADELSSESSASKLAGVKSKFVQPSNYLDAEANARLFRRFFAYDDQNRPLLDLPAIVTDRLGVRIFLIDTAGIEGASVVAHGEPFVFLAPRFAPRMLFTLAHEIAHILFHQGDQGEFLSIDYDSPSGGGEQVSRRASRDELFAHAFASALLMPDGAVGSLLKVVRSLSKITGPLGDVEISYVARFFGVSFLAAATRCESLKLLPSGAAVSIDEAIRKEFGSAEKRASQLGLPERLPITFPNFPDDLRTSAIRKIKDGTLSIGRASSELGITVEDLISANEQMVH